MLPSTPYRILLAHPSEDVRALARRALATQRHLLVVGEAADERRLLHLTAKLRPDLILISASAPGHEDFDGLAQPEANRASLTRRLKQQLPQAYIVVVADDAGSCAHALGDGAAVALLRADLADRLLPALEQVLPRNGHNGGEPAAAPLALVAHPHEGAVPLVAPSPRRRAAYVLGLDVFFNARHFVVRDGKPGPVHPHSFRVNVKIRQSVRPGNGHVLGFGEVRQLVQSETNQFNDTLLNNVPPFNEVSELQPTTENLAAVIFQSIQQNLPVTLRLDSVTVWESPTAYVTYSEDPE